MGDFQNNYTGNRLEGGIEFNTLMLLTYSDEHFLIVRNKIEPDLFSLHAFQKIARKAVEFIDKYQKPPKEHLWDLLEAELHQGDSALLEKFLREAPSRSAQINPDYVMETLNKFLRLSRIQGAIIKATEALTDEDLDTAEAELLDVGQGAPEGDTDFYSFRSIAELRKEEEEKAATRVAYVERLLFAGDATMLVGPPVAGGKSTFASAIVKCLRTGTPFLGGLLRCQKLEVVAYAAYERNGRRVRERFSDWGIEDGVVMAYQPKPFKTVKELARWLEGQIVTTGAQALCLDNLQSLLSLADTDKLGAVSIAMQELNNLARRTNCAILALVWQSAKQEVAWTGPIQFMGSSAYQGLAEVTIQVGLKNGVRCMRAMARGEADIDPIAYDINLETGDMKNEILADVEADRNLDKIMAFLSERAEAQTVIQGATAEEIAKGVKIRYQIVIAALARGEMRGALVKSGSGKKADPRRWFLYTRKLGRELLEDESLTEKETNKDSVPLPIYIEGEGNSETAKNAFLKVGNAVPEFSEGNCSGTAFSPQQASLRPPRKKSKFAAAMKEARRVAWFEHPYLQSTDDRESEMRRYYSTYRSLLKTLIFPPSAS